MTIFHFKILKVKNKDMYFKFEQYLEDGYGMYEANISKSSIMFGDIPTLFSYNGSDADNLIQNKFFGLLKNYSCDDVEFKNVTLEIEDHHV